MACTDCAYTKIIPTCITEITVGTITELAADVYVFVKNISTGKIDRFSSTSDGAGLVKLSSIAANFFMDSYDYEIWITLRSAGQNDKLDMEIDGNMDVCFAMPFADLYDGAGEKLAITSHVLTAETS